MSYRCCDGLEFLKQLPDKSVDGIFTDPPWGSGPDIQGQDVWKQLIKQMAEECPRILKPRARVLIWIGARMVGETVLAVGRNLEYKFLLTVRYIPPRYISCFQSEIDAILYYSLPGEKMYWRKGKYIPQELKKPSSGKSDTLHPCGRPANIVSKWLALFFSPGEYVIDPFAGSDTVGVACRDLGIKYDTCEIDPKMFKTGLVRNAQKYLFEGKLA